MPNKVATQADYWMCSDGMMPAQIQHIQRIPDQNESKIYLSKSDTATAPMNDFVCKNMMLLSALVAALVAVLIALIGGSAFGAIIAIGAAGGAGGAVLGNRFGGLTCGQKAAVARTWLENKSSLQINDNKAITTGSILKCNIFNSEIVHAPNVKTWWDALRIGMGSFGETAVAGALGGALVGAGGALSTETAILSLPVISTLNMNVFGSFIAWGMAARISIFANEAFKQQSINRVNITDSSGQDAASLDVLYPEANSIKRIASGNPQPMDAMLLLYFLNLRISKEHVNTMQNDDYLATN